MEYERIQTFIQAYSKDDKESLQKIYDNAVATGVPVIRIEMRDYLKTILNMTHPTRILEVGTAVGYSSLYMAECLSEIGLDFHIASIELDENNAKIAEQNIRYLGRQKQINIHVGDAAEVMKRMREKRFEYDFIFIDAAKSQNQVYMEEAIQMAHPGTVIITDNIFMDSEILESHFLVEKRDRTIHDRLRQYLHSIKNDPRIETSIVAVGDGIAMSVVK